MKIRILIIIILISLAVILATEIAEDNRIALLEEQIQDMNEQITYIEGEIG